MEEAMRKEMVVIHCSDTYAGMDVGVEEIRQWHKARGWQDIGYALVIRRNGVVEKGRDLDGDGDVCDEIGAHAAGFNRQSIGICLVGGRGEGGQPFFNFTRKQLLALETALIGLTSRFPGIKVLGHRDLPGVTKACPCFDAGVWWGKSTQRGVL